MLQSKNIISDADWKSKFDQSDIKIHNKLPVKSPALSVGILLLPQFNLTSVSSFIDVLRLAADRGAQGQQKNCTWSLIAPGKVAVSSSGGIPLPVERQPTDPQQFDYLVIFGNTPDPDYHLDEETLRYLKRAAQTDLTFIGVGGGVAALLSAKLINNGPVCVHWFHHDDYVTAFGDIPLSAEGLYREEGKVITCAGGTAAMDLAIKLIKRHLGERWAGKCQRMLLLDQVRNADHLQSVPALSEAIRCEVTRRAVRIIEQRIGEPIQIDKLAQSLNLCRRQLERKFRREIGKSVHVFTRDLRLRVANSNIVNTSRTILDISISCGFQAVENFNVSYKNKYGYTPTQARQRAQINSDNRAVIPDW